MYTNKTMYNKTIMYTTYFYLHTIFFNMKKNIVCCSGIGNTQQKTNNPVYPTLKHE